MPIAFRRITARFAFTVLAGAGLASAGSASEIDPALGSPFIQRERPTLGVETAPVVVIEVMSYNCAHCRRFDHDVFPAIRERYIAPGKVRWIMIPASENPADSSTAIFKIGRCAEEQGVFWKLLDFMFDNGRRPSYALDDLLEKDSSVDAAAIEECLGTFHVRQEVAGDFAELNGLMQKGLFDGTPTFFLRKRKANGQIVETRVDGEQRLGYFSKVLDKILAAP